MTRRTALALLFAGACGLAAGAQAPAVREVRQIVTFRFLPGLVRESEGFGGYV